MAEPTGDERGDEFTFVELFCGIGGFRIGLEALGGRCVWVCEIDRKAAETYRVNFGQQPYHDVRSAKPGKGLPKTFAFFPAKNSKNAVCGFVPHPGWYSWEHRVTGARRWETRADLPSFPVES